MKKVLSFSIMIIALALFVNFTEANAQNGKGKGKMGNQGKQNSSKFIDANGDGVCDSFVDANNDGKCDHCVGTGEGTCKGMGKGGKCGKFVDANGDGKCDNFVDADGDGKCDISAGKGNCDGTGKGMGQGGKCGKFVDANGDGKCDSFVDADGDLKCDNCTGTGTCDGTGKGKGMGQGKGKGCKGSCKQLEESKANFDVNQNTPNPVTGSTKITINLKSQESVNVALYDYAGAKVKDIYNGVLRAGENVVEFSGSDLNPGNYFYVVEVAGKIQSKNMMIIK